MGNREIQPELRDIEYVNQFNCVSKQARRTGQMELSLTRAVTHFRAGERKTGHPACSMPPSRRARTGRHYAAGEAEDGSDRGVSFAKSFRAGNF